MQIKFEYKSRQLIADEHQVNNKFTVYLGHIDLLYMGEGLSLWAFLCIWQPKPQAETTLSRRKYWGGWETVDFLIKMNF